MNGFLEMLFLKLNGYPISKKQALLLTKIFEEFYTFHDDELEPPSSQIVALSSSCGMKLPQVLSCGLNSWGEYHGCFSEAANLILNEYRSKKPYYAGFGHPKYKDEDPRVIAVLLYAKKIKYNSINIINSCEFSKRIKLPLNFGGLMACILLDCGCTLHTIDAFPIICRIIGWSIIHNKVKQYKIPFDSGYEVIKRYNSANNL